MPQFLLGYLPFCATHEARRRAIGKGVRTVRLTEIRVYPVKALRGATHLAAEVEPRGLAGDRRWMVVDEAGRFISQRELPRMVLVTASRGQHGIALTAEGLPQLLVAAPWSGPRVRVGIWKDVVAALDAGDVAATWLSRALATSCRLVFQADAASRPVKPAYAQPGEMVSFADGFPLLLASMESLADLNRRLAVPVPMLRFRPNLVITGAAAWAEDTWRRIGIGQAVFRVAKPCDRCIVTTIDPETGQQPDGNEPLRTLQRFRRGPGGLVYFGQNLVPERCGQVRVGDAIEVLETGPSNVMQAEAISQS